MPDNRPLGWDDPLEEGVQPTPVFLPGQPHGQRGLVGYSPKESDTGVSKSLTRLKKLSTRVRIDRRAVLVGGVLEDS